MVYRRSPIVFCSLCNAPHHYSVTRGCRGCAARERQRRLASMGDRSTWSTCPRCGESAPLASRHPRSICTACATAMVARRRPRPEGGTPRPKPAPAPPSLPPPKAPRPQVAACAATLAAVEEARAALTAANAARRKAAADAKAAARAWHTARADYRQRCRLYADACRGLLPLDPTA